MHTLEAARRQERVKLMATPGGSLDEAKSPQGFAPALSRNGRRPYSFRDTKTSPEMKPCGGPRTRLWTSPAGARLELTAETQARVEGAARNELSARGLWPHPADVQLDQIQGQDPTEPVIDIRDWDGPDKPPHPRELRSSRIRPTLRAVQPAAIRGHSFQHEQIGSRAPARLSSRPASVLRSVLAPVSCSARSRLQSPSTRSQLPARSGNQRHASRLSTPAGGSARSHDLVAPTLVPGMSPTQAWNEIHDERYKIQVSSFRNDTSTVSTTVWFSASCGI